MWDTVHPLDFFLQKELHFDDEFVLQQIQYTDMLQMVQIQKCGYSAKYTFKVGSCHVINNTTVISLFICKYKMIRCQI